jgi:hypothetical protein
MLINRRVTEASKLPRSTKVSDWHGSHCCAEDVMATAKILNEHISIGGTAVALAAKS